MIKVLLFAQLQESAGQSELTIDKTSITVNELKTFVQETYQLPSITHAMVAVNEEYADDDHVVNDGDTVAFIPPVSGG